MRTAGFLAAVALAAGCGYSPSAEGLVPVTGTVTVGGQPLRRAIVNFNPTGDTLGQGAEALTDADGRYVIKDRRGVNAGTFAGTYKVTVSKRVLPDGSEIPPDDPRPLIEIPSKESLPQAYSNPDATTLTAVVPPEGGVFDFALGKTKK